MIVLVFSDRHTEEVSEAEALRICSDPQRAGKIIDALTPDSGLQKKLRHLMDTCYGQEDDD